MYNVTSSKKETRSKYMKSMLRKATRSYLRSRDGDVCYYCNAYLKEKALTIDHKLALSLGGTNDLSNLVLSCVDCNNEKSKIEHDRAEGSRGACNDKWHNKSMPTSFHEYNTFLRRAKSYRVGLFNFLLKNKRIKSQKGVRI